MNGLVCITRIWEMKIIVIITVKLRINNKVLWSAYYLENYMIFNFINNTLQLLEKKYFEN